MRTRRTVALLALGVALTGCGDDGDGSDPAPSTSTAPDAVGEPDGDGGRDGRRREGADDERLDRLHVPAGIDESGELVPLVVALHGGGGAPDQFARQNGLEDLADEEGFVVVHAAGTAAGRLRTWNAGDCCGPAAREDVDDVAHIRALVDELSASLPIDPDRVYAIGHSNGGMLAYRLACDAADVFAAVGLQAGALGIDTCAPAAPVSLLHVHGTADATVPVEGGRGSGLADVDLRAAQDSAAAVAAAQRCADEPVTAPDPGVAGVETRTWTCPEGVTVRLDLVEGGEHQWFGGRGRFRPGDETAEVDSSRRIWEFLDQHPRP